MSASTHTTLDLFAENNQTQNIDQNILNNNTTQIKLNRIAIATAKQKSHTRNTNKTLNIIHVAMCVCV